MRLLCWLNVALLLLASCKETPTSILLTITPGPKLQKPDELRLTIFSETGVEVKDSRIPETGAPTLPDDLVLFPGSGSGQVRILVRGLAQGSVVGEGYAVVDLRSGEQVREEVIVRAGTLPDADGDGVPDVIDNCVTPNPDQGPCMTPDGGPDGGADGGTDGGADGAADLTPDINCDVDKDTFLSKACGGLDCDDQDDKVFPGQKEGLEASPTCQDGKDNDCDGKTDQQDTGCHSCVKDQDCDDKNDCTVDKCSGGRCSNTPTSDGKGCDDDKYCTVSDACKAGVCSGQPRDCQSGAPLCNTGSCDEGKNACVLTPLKDGTACDDKDSCTQREACQAGKCVDPGVLAEDIAQHNITLRSDRALAIDSKGKLHTVYHEQGGKDLRYATNASGSWTNERVGPSAGVIGTWSAIAFDAQDTAYIAFTDLALNKTAVAHRTSGSTSWKFDFLGASTGHNSIAVDGTGVMHVSYQDEGDLYYASGKPSSWNTVKVDPGPTTGTDDVGYHSSLAVDASGKVHIAHGQGETVSGSGGPLDQVTKLRYSTNTTGSWTTVEPVQGVIAGDYGGFASLAVGQGKVFITHSSNTDFNSKTGTIYFTTLDSGTWSTTTFGSAAKQSGSYSSLLLDSKGNAHVAYRDPATNMLMHATNVGGGSWALTQVVSQGNGTNGWAAIAQQKSGTLHVTFEDGNKKVRHASFSACP